MSNYRKIKSTHTAPEAALGHHVIRQAFPLRGLEQISPFILLHHFNFEIEPGDDSFYVPPHPHRGFCPITYMFDGAIEHNDSLGNSAVIGNNEVQWINAGRGIIHSEKITKSFAQKGGKYQGIQLWINLPAAEKMNTPSYQPITQKEIVLIEKEGVAFRLVSGSFEDKKGPAKSDVLTAMITMDANSSFNLPSLPAQNNVAIYVLEGKVRINEKLLETAHSLLNFDQTEGAILLEAINSTKILLMAGTPINEPLVTHGPFVMNTQTELLEAMRDYRQGKMGFLAG